MSSKEEMSQCDNAVGTHGFGRDLFISKKLNSTKKEKAIILDSF